MVRGDVHPIQALEDRRRPQRRPGGHRVPASAGGPAGRDQREQPEDQPYPAAGGRELGALATAINAMLERIDRGYQAQARFVSDASHELRTPISVIQGYANMLDRWGKDDPEVRQEAIDAIRAEAASMGTLAEQLLFLARGQQHPDRPQKAHGPVRSGRRGVPGDCAAGDLLGDRQRDSARRPVLGDPGLIKQALRILVDNGVKYTPEGGSVTIRLQAAEAEGNIRLSVTDTGAGIAREELPWSLSASTGRISPGPGDRRHRIGAAHRQGIAARHNGRIQATSKPGWVPLHAAAALGRSRRRNRMRSMKSEE